MSVSQPSLSGSTSRLVKRPPTDHSKPPAAIISTQPLKPRKKLQKNSNRATRSNVVTPPPHPTGSLNSSASSLPSFPAVPQHAGPPIQRSLPSPDLSDPIWTEYLRSSGLTQVGPPDTSDTPARRRPEGRDVDEHQLQGPNHVSPVLSEFSHLAIRDASSRPSLDSSAASSPASLASTVSTMRRGAKTPVFSIGQLEANPGLCTGNEFELSAANQTSAQSRAYPGISDADPIFPYSSSGLDSYPSVKDHHQPIQTVDAEHTRAGWPSTSISMPPPSPYKALDPSPVPDEGTFVEFDEEAIYFKPLSFPAESTSPLQKQDSDDHPRLSSTAQENLDLQMCTELLTRELGKVMLDSSGHEADPSALQIKLMTEAYERLRGRVLEIKESQPEGLSGIETMFDSWLGALYALHQRWTMGMNV
ncbi:hypothetical protein SODALDRAFT_329099 [Sodiomyces alkalinus F11]|uniref:Mating-type switching protein swi10 n=1 Tax=Sodiomyces alkalinus (strain CBS 110278 / VKM F-3762 / F11) TaxID=1314773 RepID=A0A3N2PK41_SODAK|nr:hypothetical protein SODALDRAFT_329099 [Sodiomyces alkalinus F11]ROT34898.1 hypothetical protein SODALDRAFT_329099 [Sodiomyces alkalinus F11]